jgi:2-dehydro-3-deoxy-D-gluconate 5-dehydrogenase
MCSPITCLYACTAGTINCLILDHFRLDGKTALVTGASTGLGAAMAFALAEAGADVIVHGNSRSPKQTCQHVERIGRRAAGIQADLSQPGAAEDLFAKAQQVAPIDIVVNNAGIIRRAEAVEYSDEDWAAVLQVNLNSLWKLCQAAGRDFISRGAGGKIINIASLLAFQGGITVPAYAASKGAVAQLTKALANEWAAKGVNVNAIAPGYMRTDNTRVLQQDETRNRQILERVPAGRWGEPEEVCGAAVFLASRASNYIHGHVLVVDGGWLAR